MTQRKILFIGAHPDDADILCGGTAIKLSEAGHLVKFVSVTNGDTGHHILSRKETAETRYREAQEAAKVFGLCEYQILNHDCGIEPTVDIRREVCRIIRNFAPDIVISIDFATITPTIERQHSLSRTVPMSVWCPTSAKKLPHPIKLRFLPSALISLRNQDPTDPTRQ